MKTVLVTGATGLIGRHTAAPLNAAGFTVNAVARRPGTWPSATWTAADLLDLGGLESIFAAARLKYLLHLAWDTRPGIYLEDNANFAWVAATLEMLRLFHKYGGERAVLAGTCFEYAFSNQPLREDGQIEAVSTYAKCKDHLNRLAARFCRKNDISYGWGRIFYVYGSGEKAGRLTPSVLAAARTGESLTIKSGPLVRDYMYVKDIAAAFVKFLDSDVEGDINICTGTGVSIRGYCEKLAGKLGRGDCLVFDDQPGSQPPVIVGDCRRLRNEVGFTPAYDLDGSLGEIAEESRTCP